MLFHCAVHPPREAPQGRRCQSGGDRDARGWAAHTSAVIKAETGAPESRELRGRVSSERLVSTFARANLRFAKEREVCLGHDSPTWELQGPGRPRPRAARQMELCCRCR